MTLEPTPGKALRLWPGVAAVVPQWLALIVFMLFVPEGMLYGIIAGLVGGLLVSVWWLFFSRAPWLERLGALVLMPIGVFATMPFVHPSIANAGMGKLLPIFSIPVLSLALVAWAAGSRGLSNGARRASMGRASLLRCGVLTVVRTGGITGGGRVERRLGGGPSSRGRPPRPGGHPAPAPRPPPPTV